MALGARLVADDRTEVVAIDNRLIARCPPAIRGLVEARGVGLLRAETSGEVPVVLVADLGRTEEQRLPPYRRITLMGCELDLVLHPRNDHFPEALLLYLRNGRQA